MSAKRIFAYIAIAAFANFLVIGSLFGELGFNVVRVIICFFGGSMLVSESHAPLGIAALAGVWVLAVDHILLKGGAFLAMQFFFPSNGEPSGYVAFGGVIISFIMFAPFAAALSWLGGWLARRYPTNAGTRP